jgi:hypothetical protein
VGGFAPVCGSNSFSVLPFPSYSPSYLLLVLLSASEGTMRASDTAEGRRAAVARGVIYRVIYGTTKTPFAYRPISDLGESRRSEQMADG